MEKTCKACQQTLRVDDFYRYSNGHSYAKCKKCHNKGRNNYTRKRDHTDQAPSQGVTTLMMITPEGEHKFFAFDFVNHACRELANATPCPTC